MRYLFLFFILVPLSLSAKTGGKALADSLSAILPTLKEDTNKVNVLDNLSYTLYTITPDSGTYYARQMLALAQKLKWEKGTAAAYNNLGVNAEARMEHDVAVQYYHKAIALFDKLGKKDGMAGALTNIANVYANQGDFTAALDYCFKSLKIYEAMSSDFGRATVSQNIGTIYLELKDYASAIRYGNNALKLHEQTNNKQGAAHVRINLANVYNATGDYPKALENCFSALKAMTELGNKRSVRIVTGNIGEVYAKMGDYTKALEYQQRSLELSKEMGSTAGIAINLGNMGETWYKIATEGKGSSDNAALQKSINYISEAVALCKSINFTAPMLEFNEFLSKAYYTSGQYKNAYETFSGHVKMKDSIFSYENKMEIARLEAKREAELKNKDKVIVANEGKINKLSLEVKRSERLIYIFSIILLLFLVSLTLKYVFSFSRANDKLREEKLNYVSLLKKQTENIRSQREVLEEISHLHSHTVRRPIASILGLAGLFNTKNPADPINKEIIDGITAMTHELDMIVKDIVKKENAITTKI